MGAWCKERQIQYTRYCDDMTFSGTFDGKELKNKVRSYLQVMGFELNNKKTKVMKKDCRQVVTGLVVNEKLNVEREFRRKLRAEIYYCKRYGVEAHLKHSGQQEWMCEDGLDTVRYLQHLQGQVNYILSVSPGDEQLKWAEEIKEMMSEKMLLKY